MKWLTDALRPVGQELALSLAGLLAARLLRLVEAALLPPVPERMHEGPLPEPELPLPVVDVRQHEKSFS